jgi:hypothetical protein
MMNTAPLVLTCSMIVSFTALADDPKAGPVVAWGPVCWDLPEPNENFIELSGKYGLKTDGSVAWLGNNDAPLPDPNTGFIEISAGGTFALGLKDDGSIVGWGDNTVGQLDVPEPNEGFVSVAAGGEQGYAIKEDGSIVAWGLDELGLLDIPEPNEGFVGVATGGAHCLALKSDGSLVAWGVDCQFVDPPEVPSPNEGFVAVDIGGLCGKDFFAFSIGLKDDGSVSYWSDDGVSHALSEPGEHFVAISAGVKHAVGLRDDGSVETWVLIQGTGDPDPPFPNAGFTAISAITGCGPGVQAAGFAIRAKCAADVNCDGAVDVLDFVAFQELWQAQDPGADCDVSGSFDILDFVCYQNLFQAGCP